MRDVWRDDESVDPNTHNKLATYHSWFVTLISRNDTLPYINTMPRHLHASISRFFVCFVPSRLPERGLQFDRITYHGKVGSLL